MNEVGRYLQPLGTAKLSVAGDSPRDDVKFLRAALVPDADGKINEEQLFAGIVEERLKIRRGRAIAGRFRTLFDEAKVD